jgi:hypothetical protein
MVEGKSSETVPARTRDARNLDRIISSFLQNPRRRESSTELNATPMIENLQVNSIILQDERQRKPYLLHHRDRSNRQWSSSTSAWCNCHPELSNNDETTSFERMRCLDASNLATQHAGRKRDRPEA